MTCLSVGSSRASSTHSSSGGGSSTRGSSNKDQREDSIRKSTKQNLLAKQVGRAEMVLPPVGCSCSVPGTRRCLTCLVDASTMQKKMSAPGAVLIGGAGPGESESVATPNTFLNTMTGDGDAIMY